jgi:hypothetical protein
MDDAQAGQVSRRIGASPDVLYGMVTDVTAMGTWTAECQACRWLDGATTAAPGVRFEGDNRFEDFTWSTVSVVDEATANRRFAFHVVDGDGHPLTRWCFTFRPDGDDATVVTESFERVALPDPGEAAFEDEQFGGRVRRNLSNMAATLTALPALVEAEPAGRP